MPSCETVPGVRQSVFSNMEFRIANLLAYIFLFNNKKHFEFKKIFLKSGRKIYFKNIFFKLSSIFFSIKKIFFLKKLMSFSLGVYNIEKNVFSCPMGKICSVTVPRPLVQIT